MTGSLLTATDVADAASITAFLCGVIFITGYTYLAPWWRYAVGRAIVSLDAAILVTLLPTVLKLVFHVNGHTLFYVWYTASSLFLVSATTLWRLKTLRRIQHHNTRPPATPLPVDDPHQEDE